MKIVEQNQTNQKIQHYSGHLTTPQFAHYNVYKTVKIKWEKIKERNVTWLLNKVCSYEKA